MLKSRCNRDTNNSPGECLLKLADLGNLYENRLQQLNTTHVSVNKTRLQGKVLSKTHELKLLT